MIERILRPYDLGSTQWYVLYQLANTGPTPQRNFPHLLQIEKPAFSGVVAALLRKGLIRQTPDPHDLRQRLLSLTKKGEALWQDLPDPIEMIRKIAFEGIDEDSLETVKNVLRTATERLNDHATNGDQK